MVYARQVGGLPFINEGQTGGPVKRTIPPRAEELPIKPFNLGVGVNRRGELPIKYQAGAPLQSTPGAGFRVNWPGKSILGEI